MENPVSKNSSPLFMQVKTVPCQGQATHQHPEMQLTSLSSFEMDLHKMEKCLLVSWV